MIERVRACWSLPAGACAIAEGRDLFTLPYLRSGRLAQIPDGT